MGTSQDAVSWGTVLFKNVTLNADKTVDTQSTTGKTMVFYDDTATTVRADGLVDNCLSGTTASANSMFFNTANNNIDYYNGSVVASGDKYSFPLAIVTVSNGTVTSVDQVFNGIGYIGATVFALTGLKGMVPAGLDLDGALVSNAFTTTSVSTWSGSTSYTANKICFAANGSVRVEACEYNPKTNTINLETQYCIAGTVSATTGGQITSFEPCSVLQVVQYVINDNSTSTTETWSASKLNAVIGNIETLLATLLGGA